ncbi:DUF4157 domain-containing protein [Bradyrhizobium sp. 170]|uniref:eCIS core domain-containing protein n=1 Tax=Bradyrhizobium sp. 170 TaxID=2782641 RepID=UPI0020002317|nr:DUF4157 domain-containing protein [Bradyrhizobium sp. 170]UPK05422.1 DUF4157 domain-containing protein [Bradyrhizobium sp. 170]
MSAAAGAEGSSRRKVRAPAAPVTHDTETMSRAAERQGPGEALPTHLRAPAEQSLGLPLDDVRLHRDSGAGAFTRFTNARAAQWQNHIFVRPDLYAPDEGSGRDLLGHELVHAGQYAAFGAGAAPVSGGHEASEAEARTLAPKVLGGEPDAAAPRTAPAASVNREGPPGTDQVSSEAPLVCDPDSMPEGDAQTSSSEAEAPAEPVSDGLDFTQDPTTIDVQSMTNGELIAQARETTRIIARFKVSSPETAAWDQLKLEIEDERKRRIGRGFIFLADKTDETPMAFFTLQAGARSRDWLILKADITVAYGPADVTLTGPIMNGRQINAYIDTLGYQRVTGTVANLVLANSDAIMPVFDNAFMPGLPGLGGSPLVTTGMGWGTHEDDWTRPGTLPQYGGLGRYGMLDTTLGGRSSSLLDLAIPRKQGNFPVQLADQNFRGAVGELSVQSDWRTGWGMGVEDMNTRGWTDRNGVYHPPSQHNFPVVDFGPRSTVPQILGINLISVTTSGAATYDDRKKQYFNKLDILLDTQGRRPSAAPNANLILNHLQTASGKPLTPGTPDYAAAEARFLSDTMFAVPEGDLAAMRSAIADPNAAPTGGTNRMVTRAGFKDLYDASLRSSPIEVTLKDGSKVSITSLQDLATRAPRADSLPESMRGSGSMAGGQQRMDAAQFDQAMRELGKTASSRVISVDAAADFAAAADAARGGGTGTTPATRVLEIGSSHTGYVGARIGEGIADPRSPGAPGSGTMRWTTAVDSDPMLAALRNLSGDHTLTRNSPGFAAVRAQYLANAQLAFNADDVAAFRSELRGANVDATGKPQAWSGKMRERFGAVLQDSPIVLKGTGGSLIAINSPDALDNAFHSGQITPEQYSAAQSGVQEHLAGRVLRTNVTTEGLAGLEGLADTARTKLPGAPGEAVTPATAAEARLGSGKATASAAKRGAGTGFVVGVATTLGMMWIDEREHPDWQIELAKAGARDTLIGGTQSAIEHRVEAMIVNRATSQGLAASPWAKFGGRAGVGGTFAVVTEGISIATEDREHSEGEVPTRLARAAGIAILSTEIGAAVGSIVPGPGTAVGAVAGFLVGAAAGIGAAILMDSALPMGKEDWDKIAAEKQARKEAEARRQAEEAFKARIVGNFGDNRTLTPTMSSPDITTEEQEAIATWVNLMRIAQPSMPSDLVAQ